MQSLNKAMTFCLFTDFTVSFTVYLEVKLPHCQGWKVLLWFLCSRLRSFMRVRQRNYSRNLMISRFELFSRFIDLD